jgi:hypothetical protein
MFQRLDDHYASWSISQLFPWRLHFLALFLSLALHFGNGDFFRTYTHRGIIVMTGRF